MVELFINGTASAVGQLTLFGDEPLSLNISVSDIKDISKRNSTFSQTFTLPADKNNNILLNHIFNIGADSSFDPTKKTQCYILNDGIPVFNGQFQLTKINVKNRNVISYESVVYGEMVDLVKTLGDKLITGNKNPEDDLDFSELDHNRDSQTIFNSWSADTKDLGYYYPLIDYGYDLDIREINDGVLSISVVEGYVSVATLNTMSDITQSWTTDFYSTIYHEYSISIISGLGQGQTRFILSNTAVTITTETDWTIIPDTTSVYTINKIDTSNPYTSTGNGLRPSIFKPALSSYYLFKKIMDSNGFYSTGDFIESDVFTETIIPYNNIDAGLNLSDIRAFRANLSATFSYYPSVVLNPSTLLTFPFDDDYNKGFDRSNLYDTATFRYTAPAGGVFCTFFVDLSYKYNKTYIDAIDLTYETFYIRYYRSSYAGGLTHYHQDFIQVNRCPGYDFLNNPPPPGAALGPGSVKSFNTPYIQLAPGEQVWVKIYVYDSTASLHQIYNTDSCFYNEVFIPGTGIVNNYIEYNSWLPRNIKQVDFIKSVITMFNLMVIPNKNNPKRLTFIPRNEYYAAGEVKDWSNKIDHTERIEEVLISEQQSKSIRLTYKEDKDYYNANYKEKVNSVYGEYIEVIDNEWVTGEKKIEVIFSPTPVDKVFGSTDIYLPKISKRDEKTGAYSRTDFNIRILRKNKNLMPTQDTIKVIGLPSMNSYPYCGHLDHPINPLIDYNFGAVSFVYYEGLSTMTPHNLVYDYWKQYLDDINDKNSKLIKCKIYLTPDDIAQFNYNDSIYIEGLTDDGGHYFNVNKINYTPTSNLPSTIELIKVNRRPDVEAPSIELSGYITLPPVRGLDIGIRNVIEAPGFISGTDNTISNTAGETIIIGGSNNYVSAPGVVLINSNNQTITEPFTTIVGNTYFPQEGDSYTLFNDIDSGLDEVIYPFAKTILNDIDSGLDAVRNIGGQSVISDIDSGNSGLN